MGWKDLKELDRQVLVELRNYTVFELETVPPPSLCNPNSKLPNKQLPMSQVTRQNRRRRAGPRKLAILMNEVETYLTSLQTGSIIDSFFHLVMFANKENFTDDLFEYLFKLFITLLENLQKKVSLEENILFFRENLTQHFSINETHVKDTEYREIKPIVEYMLQSFFQHYNLYTYLLTNKQDIKEVKHTLHIETVPTQQLYPPPLEQAINEDWYNRFIASTPVQNKPDEKEEVNDARTRELEIVEKSITNESETTKSQNETSAEYLLSNIDPNEIKRLVRDVAKEKLLSTKIELEAKINDKEASILKSLKKHT